VSPLRDKIAECSFLLLPKNLKINPSQSCEIEFVRSKRTGRHIMKIDRVLLRLILEGDQSANAIARQRGKSHNTVRRFRTIVQQSDLTLETLEHMSDKDIEGLFGRAANAVNRFAEPDLAHEHSILRRGYSRAEAHAQYVERVRQGNALAYRTYCKRLEEYLRTLDPVMGLDHAPGHALQTDFAGYMPLARWHFEGEPQKLKLFVATLPFSRLIAAEIVPTEKVTDHITANISALEQIGGCPTVMVPDNLKAAVIKRPRFGPAQIQPDYQDFLDHYGMSVVPARVRKPQDKSAVENSVKLIQRSLRLRFVDRPVPTLSQLRTALEEVVDEWNNRPMRRANGHSRRSLFEAEEKACLKRLPRDAYRPVAARAEAQVGRDYHVSFKGCFYSVPHQLIGKVVTVKQTANSVSITHDGHEVALHPLSAQAGRRITDNAHRTKEHRWYAEQDLVKWSLEFGEPVRQLAAAEMARTDNPQNRVRRSSWIKDLPRIHGRKRFEIACQRALAADDPRFEHVEHVLQRGIEGSAVKAHNSKPLVTRKNIRGSGYYRDKGGSQ